MAFICPMHLEVRSDSPGKCSKCGMMLVKEPQSEMYKLDKTVDRGLGVLSIKNYVPIIVVIGLIFLVSAAITIKDFWSGSFSMVSSISYFMAGFFIVFSGFKLMDLRGFAEGYSTYDLISSRFVPYGYIYPFIELAFGMSMILFAENSLLLILEFVVMSISGVGVLIKVMKREPVKCFCLGTFLKVPLTTVTLVEDFGMAFLALVLLAYNYGIISL